MKKYLLSYHTVAHWMCHLCVPDVDECQESALSPCQHQCLNTLGSFRCICHPGYQLSGHRCIGQSVLKVHGLLKLWPCPHIHRDCSNKAFSMRFGLSDTCKQRFRPLKTGLLENAHC